MAVPIRNKVEGRPSLKDTFEHHPVIFLCVLCISVFVAGVGFNHYFGQRGGASPASSLPVVLEGQIELLTDGHEKRMTELHKARLENEQQATYGGNIREYKEEHAEAARRIAEQIANENRGYLANVKALRGLVDAEQSTSKESKDE